MSDAVEIYGQFGQTLAVAEATLNKLLETHLATHDTPPNRWYALKLIAQGEPIARPALVDALAAGGKVQPVDAEPLLRTLTADRLVTGIEFLSLTDAGRRSFEELRQYVIAPTIRLLSQFKLADVETTIRTLREITVRASHDELRSPAVSSELAGPA